MKATFQVDTVGQAGAGLKVVTMHPVFGDTGTDPMIVAPSSYITVGVLSADAAAQFEVGKQFVVEFTLA